MSTIVLATGNLHKVAELQALLAPQGFQVKPQSDFSVSSVAETGTTFVENAIIKARHAARETGLPTIADDSGLVVEALNGRPGIYSARFAGTQANDHDNVQKLLAELGDLPLAQRSARYWCILAFMRHVNDAMPVLCCGQWQGLIANTPAGTGGFGYDPVFFLPEQQCTVAQLPAGVKQKISHRAMALKQLLSNLPIDEIKK